MLTAGISAVRMHPGVEVHGGGGRRPVAEVASQGWNRGYCPGFAAGDEGSRFGCLSHGKVSVACGGHTDAGGEPRPQSRGTPDPAWQGWAAAGAIESGPRGPPHADDDEGPRDPQLKGRDVAADVPEDTAGVRLQMT
jgi:hypothetical protein